MLRTSLLTLLAARGADAWGYCNDKKLACADWAAKGECWGENEKYLHTLCPKSCGLCPLECRDTQPDCINWAKDGECESNRARLSHRSYPPRRLPHRAALAAAPHASAAYNMLKNCPTACGLCKEKCYDRSAECGGWARDGECTKNPSILEKCPVSCGKPPGCIRLAGGQGRGLADGVPHPVAGTTLS